jgi:hypothetical protein
MVCSRYIIVNILHKYYNDDDDDDDDNNNNNNNNNNLTRILQLTTVYILPLVLSTKGSIPLSPNKTAKQLETLQSSP